MGKTVFYFSEKPQEAVLFVFDRSGNVSKYSVSGTCLIGRKSPSGAPQVALGSSIVSRDHGEITQIGEKYYYYDHESTNGTYVDGKLIGKNSPDKTLGVEIGDGSVLAIDVIKDGSHHPERIVALFTTCLPKSTSWKRVSLNHSIASINIGRSSGSGVQIENQMVSDNHASFFSASNGWAIIDHNSTNGVFLNGKRITIPQYLRISDVVRIADIFFIFLGDAILFCEDVRKETSVAHGDVAPKDLVINITERSVFQRFKKISLLQDINLSVSNGEMVLILGGSGAGKTTFINAVMGYEKAYGTITYNDTDIYEEYEQMKYEIGFVPQQDLLRGSDTVYDTLSNAAEMKLPRKMSAADREKRITAVLEELGLSREKHTLVSKLSGGQRKRLSIAVEFIADPSLFFLDEPDSGLDDIMGRGLMENLRAIADKGKIIMVITHSPERAGDLFDKVIVLAKSTRDNCGHLAFYGSVKEAFGFFGVKEFRGIVKKINRPDENGEGLADTFIEKFAAMNKKG